MNKPNADPLDELLDRQRYAWMLGDRPSPEELLSNEDTADRDSDLLDLIYNEIVIREDRGETPVPEEYLSRYPSLAGELKIQFEVHSAMRDNQASTLRLSGSLPDSNAPPTVLVSRDPTVSGYEILGALGEGGMGTVYKARDRALNRLVALKMIHPGRVPSDRELRRFRTEAEAIARLRHPNIVGIHEVGEIDGSPYLSLELAEGGTLAGRLRDFPFTPRAAAELIRSLALAIQHAHEQQIVHRDLKPANILFGKDGSARIADFGLAKILETGNSKRDTTRTGEPVGTPRYMSPEQVIGKNSEIGIPADIHALGLLLYECTTGRAPFIGSNAVQTMERIRDEEPLPPRRLQGSIPRDLQTICLRCLQKEPVRRYPSAEAVADDLGRFLEGKPIKARPTPVWEKTWKWCRRNPAATAGIAFGLLLMTGTAVQARVRSEMEARRVADMRGETLSLMEQGRTALIQKDPRTAQARFLDAWTKARSETALADLATAISGWLDHARRDEEQGVWNKRAGPRSYDDVRDEAFLLALLAKKGDGAGTSDGFIHARSLTVDGDPAWNFERELAAVVEAEAMLVGGDPASGLKSLDLIAAPTTRLWHQKRAACLEAINNRSEADAERKLAEELPPLAVWESLDRGMVLFHQGAFREAERAFASVLAADPGHFPARLFQAVCFLRTNRPTAAEVGLTACIGQRPSFAWSFLLRGEARQMLGETVAARADFERILGMKLSDALRSRLSEQLGAQAISAGDRSKVAGPAGGERE